MKTLQTLASRAFALTLWPLRALAHRQLMTTLGSFDDRALADIGLSRQDLRDATALSIAVDPSDLLNERARNRSDLALRARRTSSRRLAS